MILFLLKLSICFQAFAEDTSPEEAEQNTSPTQVAPQNGVDIANESSAQNPSEDSGKFDFSKLLEWRDPFQKPFIAKNLDEKVISPLESFPVNEFKYLGVVTGPKKLRAMLLAPNGKTYFISVGDKLGKRSGIVRKISINALTIEETIENVLGQKEVLETKLVLPGDIKISSDKS